MDWFLYDKDLRHERVKVKLVTLGFEHLLDTFFKSHDFFFVALPILFQFAQNNICCVLRDFIPFVQFNKREKHPWRSINFNKVAVFSLQHY